MMSQLQIRFIEAGFTKHFEAISLKGGSWKTIRFPASVAIIEHPKEGVILFDTGYSPRFYEQTKYFPNKFYALVTPVTIDPEETAVAQLKRLGIGANDVSKIILSHFHADHVAGVSDFPRAKYIFRDSAYESVKLLSNWGGVRDGFLRGLLPTDFCERAVPLSDRQFSLLNPCEGFSHGIDLFGDESVVVVDLPGHVDGHIGLVVRDKNDKKYFLVGDACWSDESYKSLRPPHAITKLLFKNWTQYNNTLKKINQSYKADSNLKIMPCHCCNTLNQELAAKIKAPGFANA